MKDKARTKFKQTEIGMIPQDWEARSLEQVAIFKNGMSSPSRNNLAKFPVYGSNGIIGFSEKTNSDENTIIIGRVGAYCGSIYFSKTKCWVTDNAIIGLTKAKNSSQFLYYLLKKLDLNTQKGGSSQPLINQVILYSIKTAFPRNEVDQASIAKILSDLDSKIELNLQVNKTLEVIGQSIFKHWFIDFEFPNEQDKPYKSSGGEMIFNEEFEKEIPKGWEVKELGNFIEFVKGKKPVEVFEDRDGNLIPQILIDVLDGGTPFFADPDNMILSNEADIIMVMDGASSGRTARGFAGVLGSTLAKIKVEELNQDYVYYLLKRKEEDIKENTTGTSIPHADKKKIEKYSIVVPVKRILEEFQIIVNKISFRQILIRKENKNLSQIRDSLLPKLMSGEIRVPYKE